MSHNQAALGYSPFGGLRWQRQSSDEDTESQALSRQGFVPAEAEDRCRTRSPPSREAVIRQGPQPPAASDTGDTSFVPS